MSLIVDTPEQLDLVKQVGFIVEGVDGEHIFEDILALDYSDEMLGVKIRDPEREGCERLILVPFDKLSMHWVICKEASD